MDSQLGLACALRRHAQRVWFMTRRESWQSLPVWRVGDESARGPVLVVLQSYGMEARDIAQYAEYLPVLNSLRMVIPEAPHIIPGRNGRAWWAFDGRAYGDALARRDWDEIASHVPEGLHAARASASAVIAETGERLSVSPKEIILAGYSQGSMVAYDLALTGTLPRALVLVSSILIARAEYSARNLAIEVPTFLAHGRRDGVLPFPLAERLRDFLTAAGLDVHFAPHAGGHSPSHTMLFELADFLVRAGLLCSGLLDASRD
jgi:phospholipase/carboxylesterase